MYIIFFRALKNSIAENPYFVMKFLNILNTELRIRSVFDYKTMKKANNNDVIIPPSPQNVIYTIFLNGNQTNALFYLQTTNNCLHFSRLYHLGMYSI